MVEGGFEKTTIFRRTGRYNDQKEMQVMVKDEKTGKVSLQR